MLGGLREVRAAVFSESADRACACRQTVFYTPDTLTVSEGQTISGRLSCAPNARNPRDLDIKIAYQVEDGPETEIQYKMCVVLLRISLPLPSPFLPLLAYTAFSVFRLNLAPTPPAPRLPCFSASLCVCSRRIGVGVR